MYAKYIAEAFNKHVEQTFDGKWHKAAKYYNVDVCFIADVIIRSRPPNNTMYIAIQNAGLI